MNILIKSLVGIALIGGVTSAIVFSPQKPEINIQPEVESAVIEQEPVVEPIIEPEPTPVPIPSPSPTPTPTPTPVPQPSPTPVVTIDNSLAEQLAKIEIERQTAEIEKLRLAKIEADRLAAEKLAQEALAKLIKKECTDPVNLLKQEIIKINEQYAIDLAKIKAQPGEVPMSIVNDQAGKLGRDTEAKIAAVNAQIAKIQLDCSIKYQ